MTREQAIKLDRQCKERNFLGSGVCNHIPKAHVYGILVGEGADEKFFLTCGDLFENQGFRVTGFLRTGEGKFEVGDGIGNQIYIF